MYDKLIIRNYFRYRIYGNNLFGDPGTLVNNWNKIFKVDNLYSFHNVCMLSLSLNSSKSFLKRAKVNKKTILGVLYYEVSVELFIYEKHTILQFPKLYVDQVFFK